MSDGAAPGPPWPHPPIARFFLYPSWTAALKRGPRHPPTDVETWTLDTDAGPVPALFLPARGGPRPAPLVVFCHGNGETAALWTEALSPYRERGAHVLVPEYRGYGGAPGRPTQTAIVDDVSRLVARALARGDVDGSRLVLHGRSLGGGVACATALRRAPRALVLQSTFTSVPDVAARWRVPRAWHPDVWDNAGALAETSCPVLLVHGTGDRLIPASHAEHLARVAGARAELHLVPGPHDLFPPGPTPSAEDAALLGFFRRVHAFLDRAGVG